MATELDTLILPKVLELIGRYGKLVSFSVTTGATQNAGAGTVTGGTTTAHSVKASPPYPYESRYIDGDLVLVGDSRLYLAGSGLAFTPAPGQVVTIDSAKWRVVRVNPIYSGELVAAWEVQVRR
jgi:hypothetical protein